MPPAEALARISGVVASQIPDAECRQEYLALVTKQVAAYAAALWHLSSNGVLALVAQLGLSATGVTRDRSLSERNIHRLLEVARSARPASHDDSPNNLAAAPRALPLAELAPKPGARGVLMAPIVALGRCCGVLEVFVEHLPKARERTTLLEFLCECGTLMAQRPPFCRGAQEPPERVWTLEQFDQSLALLHRSLELGQVGHAAVNEGQRLLGCDRVSLCLARGGSAVPVAISGQAQINRASAAVRCIARLAEACIRGRQEIRAPEGGEAHLPEIQQLLLQHAQAGGGRSVWVVPLAEPVQPDDTTGEGNPFAAMVFEGFTQELTEVASSSTSAMFLRHVGLALCNTRAHRSIIRRLAARIIGVSGSRRAGLSRWLLAGLLTLAAGAALAIVPSEYRVEGKGRLVPSLKRRAFAPVDAEVVELLVKGGETVRAGQPLLVLRNDELELALLAARNKLAEREQQIEALKAETDEAVRRGARADELTRLRGRIAQARVEHLGAGERMAALERQIDELTVRAPIAGTVASFRLEESLLGRPVRRGDVLLEVMDESSDWRLEASVAEHHMGHVLNALRQAPPPKARCVLATAPDAPFSGYVAEVATRTTVLPDQGTAVELHVELEQGATIERRIGAEAVVKIDCGQRSLGYVLFGDFLDLLRRTIW
jgi:biotin carboxyl carrier protein